MNITEYWNPIVETMPMEDLKELQLKKIKNQIRYCYRNSSYTRKRFEEKGLTPEEIKTWDDFRKIPVFRKQDVRDEREKTGDPFGGLLNVSLPELIQIWSSTGTSGVPTFSCYTDHDFMDQIDNLTRTSWMQGGRPGMKVMVPGVGFHWYCAALQSAYMRIGCVTWPEMIHPALSARKIPLFRRIRPDILGTDGYDVLAMITDEARKQGYDPKEVFSSIKVAISVGEPLTPKVAGKIEADWGNVRVFSRSQVGESMTMVADCPEMQKKLFETGKVWGHIWDDIVCGEFIDPETEELVSEGERGEYVITNLNSRAMAFIRFGSEDLAEYTREVCDCGRTSSRLFILSRTGWRLRIGGKIIVPLDIIQIFEEFPETEKAGLTLLRYAKDMPTLKIRAAYDENITKDPEELKGRIIKKIKEELGVNSEIEWVPYDKLPFIYHKINRVLDLKKEK
ncbi:MAG: phenylacetate--CoA ligase family protein [Candidatus Jordarchaeum sp.]|uniref:phenylacetate--CoA ligase family protein n=1 Tax=Candidatus Jordarchaeum sp. TaxID=2823881 RepID=UPI0040491C1E